MLGLSEKECYTVQELAEKWDYSDHDVLHIMLNKKLYPSFHFDKVLCKSAQWESNSSFERISPCIGIYSPLNIDWNYNLSFAFTEAKWKLDLQYSRLSYGPPKLPNIDGAEEFDMYSPVNSTIVNIEDILIMQSEVRRFETVLLRNALLDPDSIKQIDAGTEAGTHAEPFKESTRAIKNLQTILAAVAVDAYGYDPAIKGSSTVNDILTALGNVEVIIAENTIRSHLKTGAINIRLPSKD